VAVQVKEDQAALAAAAVAVLVAAVAAVLVAAVAAVLVAAAVTVTADLVTNRLCHFVIWRSLFNTPQRTLGYSLLSSLKTRRLSSVRHTYSSTIFLLFRLRKKLGRKKEKLSSIYT
jgi:hypothetical protein